MKLTVIIRDNDPLFHYGDTPSYRSLGINLTPDQEALIMLRKGEEISKCFLEPNEEGGGE